MLISLFIIIALILASAFFSMSEISLAASRRIKLQQLADDGNQKALQVLKLQKNPGKFFSVVQIGFNAVTILAGILGDSAFTPGLTPIFESFMEGGLARTVSFICSFTFVTSLFIIFADLIPKRIAMSSPEPIALKTVGVMRLLITVFKPFVWFYSGIANLIMRLLKMPLERKEELTSDDIYAVIEEGALAGLFPKEEHEIIENVFELDFRSVTSVMTTREYLIYFDKNDSEDILKQKIEQHPYQRFLVCDGSIDQVIGYVNSKSLLNQFIAQKHIKLTSETLITPALMIPDTLTLSETLDAFKTNGDDFAVIINEYALVVGIITLKDVMITLMGNFVNTDDEQILQRDENSWLIEGGTPILDVMRALNIDEFPEDVNYETLAGFIMYRLRKVPKRTDSVKFAGYRFEVIDIDHNRIDQLLVTRLKPLESQANDVNINQETPQV